MLFKMRQKGNLKKTTMQLFQFYHLPRRENPDFTKEMLLCCLTDSVVQKALRSSIW